MADVRKQLVSFAKRSPAVHAAGRLLDRVVPERGHLCTVLTFHRIETHQPHLYPGLAGLDGPAFERFVDGLVAHFHPITVRQLTDAIAGGTALPPRSVLMTFDDAYRDFADIAWPVMRSRGVPVTLFVPTAYPGEPSRQFWWDELFGAFAVSGPDRWRSLGIEATDPDAAFRSVRDTIKTMPHDDAVAHVRDLVTRLGAAPPPPTDPTRVLGWDELSALARDGVSLAPHSRTHPMLDQLTPDRLDDEIAGSRDDMCDRLGADLVTNVFAYPAGGHDPAVRAAVARAGFDAAFTTERGLVDVHAGDPHRLPRLNVGPDTDVGGVVTEVAARRLLDRRGARTGHRG